MYGGVLCCFVNKLCLTTDSSSIPWTVACQAPLSLGFSRQEDWSGVPFPSPGDLLNQRSNPRLLHWQEDSLPRSPWEGPGNGYHVLEEIHCYPYVIMFLISSPLNIIRPLLYRCLVKWILDTQMRLKFLVMWTVLVRAQKFIEGLLHCFNNYLMHARTHKAVLALFIAAFCLQIPTFIHF